MESTKEHFLNADYSCPQPTPTAGGHLIKKETDTAKKGKWRYYQRHPL